MGGFGELSFKRKLVRLLDRPGGRLVLGKLATRLTRGAMGEDIEIAYVDGHWTYRVGPDFFPGGPRFNYTPPDFERLRRQMEVNASETKEHWLQHYRPQEGDVVVDVGAGRGEDTLTFSRAVGVTGRVIAIEAHPMSFAILRKFCQLNRRVGTYEVNHLRDFGAAITPGTVVYDVGANVGIYSLLASSRTGPSGKVYAFEPLERNVRYLRRHMQLNGVENCVVLQTAVCNEEGTRQFSGASWDSHMGRLSPEGEILVPSTTIDNCVYGEKGLRPPNVLKVDVEGAEMELLQGASRALAELHPKIFLEMHSGQLYSECREFLAAKGYSMEERYTHVKATWRS